MDVSIIRRIKDIRKKAKIINHGLLHMFVSTIVVLDYFRGTNFREFFSAYIRGYLFSRMRFFGIFAGIIFREWVVSIANLLEIYVDE